MTLPKNDDTLSLISCDWSNRKNVKPKVYAHYVIFESTQMLYA